MEVLLRQKTVALNINSHHTIEIFCVVENSVKTFRFDLNKNNDVSQVKQLLQSNQPLKLMQNIAIIDVLIEKIFILTTFSIRNCFLN